ncbi:ubiquinone/menaquinone biosynthesis C-methylase UbiE [Bacillus pakistanensis]|uniref:Ubiquinone/menaquinone biosynthesis C-methylase UbiE n=1 Tax=Rossellomorea pakistanensis TaxID=992288 RepID=A0ABS2NKF1_9BACI|nr:class I SAM-dependent methyltransferase [Bacillus pakistanensis]MBM7588347.1 ubiquinone/menaquinone biosynthesis C-methylase UbiE [Bacillus pakistanensis]
MKSLDLIQNHISKVNDNWLKYLTEAEEIHQNLEYVHSIESVQTNHLLMYVKRTLESLSQFHGLKGTSKRLIEEVLKWSEVAKGGTIRQRDIWRKKGYNLIAHNEGSADIYIEEHLLTDEKNQTNEKMIIESLIRTHGLIGQYIRGESELIKSKPTKDLLLRMLGLSETRTILYTLNYCIINGVSENLWNHVNEKVEKAIDQLLEDNFTESLMTRVQKLRSKSGNALQEFEYYSKELEDLKELMDGRELWYVEPALHSFSLEDFLAVMTLTQKELRNKEIDHIIFEDMMKQIYYDYKNGKKVNVYRKRIIEKYFEDCRNGKAEENPRVKFVVSIDDRTKSAYPYFQFTGLGESLINFCIEAEKVDMMHNRAVVMLLDYFELRRDAYDRFHNEEIYLENMNSAADDKRVILDWLIGDNILDIGPGGGVMLNMIEEETGGKNVIGIDISENVIESLNKKKQAENKSWKVVKGDALNLSETFPPNSLDTIIFSSIIHELYSYIPFNGKRFNHDVIAEALKSAFSVLKPGGRMIIRDGIMTENKGLNRIIRFRNEEGIHFLKQYKNDFKGREIKFEVISSNTVKMPINDAMEALYTYTWGEESYVHEVNEQFGYFTPNEYKSYILNTLGDHVSIIEARNYLQEGYTNNLKDKLEFLDENGKNVPLPDSTFFIVIEKK